MDADQWSLVLAVLSAQFAVLMGSIKLMSWLFSKLDEINDRLYLLEQRTNAFVTFIRRNSRKGV